MPLTVKSATGVEFQLTNVDPHCTIREFKELLAGRQGAPPADDQELRFVGAQLDDAQRLESYGIAHGTCVFLGPVGKNSTVGARDSNGAHDSDSTSGRVFAEVAAFVAARQTQNDLDVRIEAVLVENARPKNAKDLERMRQEVKRLVEEVNKKAGACDFAAAASLSKDAEKLSAQADELERALQLRATPRVVAMGAVDAEGAAGADLGEDPITQAERRVVELNRAPLLQKRMQAEVERLRAKMHAAGKACRFEEAATLQAQLKRFEELSKRLDSLAVTRWHAARQTAGDEQTLAREAAERRAAEAEKIAEAAAARAKEAEERAEESAQRVKAAEQRATAAEKRADASEKQLELLAQANRKLESQLALAITEAESRARAEARAELVTCAFPPCSHVSGLCVSVLIICAFIAFSCGDSMPLDWRSRDLRHDQTHKEKGRLCRLRRWNGR